MPNKQTPSSDADPTPVPAPAPEKTLPAEARPTDTAIGVVPASMPQAIEAEVERSRQIGKRREIVDGQFRSGRDLVELLRENAGKAPRA